MDFFTLTMSTQKCIWGCFTFITVAKNYKIFRNKFDMKAIKIIKGNL